MKQRNYTKTLSFVLAALLLCLFITQLLPFWTCSDCKTHPEGDKTLSIAEYILFPLDHKPLTNDMNDMYKAVFAVDEILMNPLLVFVGCLLGIALCIFMDNKLYGIISGAIAGIAGVMGYLMHLPLQAGPNWQLHMAVAGVVAVAAVALLVYELQFKIKAVLAKRK